MQLQNSNFYYESGKGKSILLKLLNDAHFFLSRYIIIMTFDVIHVGQFFPCCSEICLPLALLRPFYVILFDTVRKCSSEYFFQKITNTEVFLQQKLHFSSCVLIISHLFHYFRASKALNRMLKIENLFLSSFASFIFNF